MSANRYRLEWADFDREPDNGVVEGPTWDDVRSLVEHLARNEDTGGFLILAKGEGDYIQCGRDPAGLIVEYHEPDGDTHHLLAGGPTDAETAVPLFRAWFENPRSIAEHGDWKPLAL